MVGGPGRISCEESVLSWGQENGLILLCCALPMWLVVSFSLFSLKSSSIRFWKDLPVLHAQPMSCAAFSGPKIESLQARCTPRGHFVLDKSLLAQMLRGWGVGFLEKTRHLSKVGLQESAADPQRRGHPILTYHPNSCGNHFKSVSCGMTAKPWLPCSAPMWKKNVDCFLRLNKLNTLLLGFLRVKEVLGY